jgi:hypothetical protein
MKRPARHNYRDRRHVGRCVDVTERAERVRGEAPEGFASGQGQFLIGDEGKTFNGVRTGTPQGGQAVIALHNEAIGQHIGLRAVRCLVGQGVLFEEAV